jgi:predicted Zn-dependent peptidase
MRKEKGVVLEEILMVEDTPDDLVHEVLTQTFYQEHPLGAPILGTKESVSSFARENLVNYMGQHYNAASMLIAAAGNFDETALMDILEEKFSGVPAGGVASGANAKPVHSGKLAAVKEKDIEQLNIALALPGYSMTDEKYYPLLVLNNVLGGSMSSRLFQKIREEKGLAYSVYSYTSSYRNSGSLGFYAGTNAEQGEQVLMLMLEEMRSLAKDSLTTEEFTRSRDQLRGNYVLSSESTNSRMMSIGKSLLIYDRVLSEEDVFARIEGVTYEDIRALTDALFDLNKLCAAFVGRSEKTAQDWLQLW